MQNNTRDTRAAYRERLTPSLLLFVSAAVVAPMAALVFVPAGAALALTIGAVVAIAVVALLIVASPVVEVRDGWLHAGRARIDARFLGPASVHSGEDARHQRGPGLDTRSWHLIRGGIDSLVVIPIEDPDDPVPAWVVSTRTPDRLAAAVARASATQRTPGR